MGSSLYRVTKTPYFCAEKRLTKYPQVQFLVIVNPNSGPGNNTLGTDANFIREIPRLNSYANVRTIGYVRTGWTTRDIDIVLSEVSTYASWSNSTYSSGPISYELSGIFFDEAPNNYTTNGQTYMNRIDQFVKTNSGFGGVNYVVSPRLGLLIVRLCIILDRFLKIPVFIQERI